MTLSIRERLDKHSKPRKSGCIDWISYVDKGGYGRVFFNGVNMKASRVSFMINKGPIPKGMLVCHTCDNRKCINPDHLFIGTNMDNNMDCILKGRNRFKLNPKKVIKIRKLLDMGQRQRIIAEKYGVHKDAIRYIKSGRTWSHVQ